MLSAGRLWLCLASIYQLFVFRNSQTRLIYDSLKVLTVFKFLVELPVQRTNAELYTLTQ